MPPKLPSEYQPAPVFVSPYYRSYFEVSGKTTGLPPEMPTSLDNKGHAVGFLLALHKCQQDDNPYRIPNEFICATLGTALGLPISPFALTVISDVDKRKLFSSLNFNPGGLRLPRIEPDICMKALPKICVGILVFDVWVANDDRHDENLAVDKTASPTMIRVFDHDHTLFGGPSSKQNGNARLDELRSRLGITGSTTTGGTPHVFLQEISDDLYLREWVDRVKSIPDWMVEEPCWACHRHGLTKDEVKKVIDFLLHRREIISQLIFGDLCRNRNIDISPSQGKLFRERQ